MVSVESLKNDSSRRSNDSRTKYFRMSIGKLSIAERVYETIDE